jgi:hypothetical protein
VACRNCDSSLPFIPRHCPRVEMPNMSYKCHSSTCSFFPRTPFSPSENREFAYFSILASILNCVWQNAYTFLPFLPTGSGRLCSCPRPAYVLALSPCAAFQTNRASQQPHQSNKIPQALPNHTSRNARQARTGWRPSRSRAAQPSTQTRLATRSFEMSGTMGRRVRTGTDGDTCLANCTQAMVLLTTRLPSTPPSLMATAALRGYASPPQILPLSSTSPAAHMSLQSPLSCTT